MPSQNIITTSIVINFDAGDSGGILTAEIDGRPDGYNGGKTSFSPGEQPVFLVYKSANVEIISIEQSAGNVAYVDTGLIDLSEMLQFAKVKEASLQKPITGPLTYKWLGNDLGAVTVVGDTKLKVPTLGIGVLKANYQSRWMAFRLSGLGTTLNGESTYEVLVYITGQVI